jgi:hypothetical protein
MNIKTEYDPPPIPFRGNDWTAIETDTYCGPDGLVGYGETEAQAIDDLFLKMQEEDDIEK